MLERLDRIEGSSARVATGAARRSCASSCARWRRGPLEGESACAIERCEEALAWCTAMIDVCGSCTGTTSAATPEAAIGGAWRISARAAGSVAVGVNRVRLGPGEMSTPAHVHGADEEMFFVLDGCGLSVAGRRRRTRSARATRIVHARAARRTRCAPATTGSTFLVFGARARRSAARTCRRRASTGSCPTWTEAARASIRSDREPALEWPEPEAERPADDRRTSRTSRATYGGDRAGLGEAAGARHDRPELGSARRPGDEGAPPHCHSAEEEAVRRPRGRGRRSSSGRRRIRRTSGRPSRPRRMPVRPAMSSRGRRRTRVSACLPGGRRRADLSRLRNAGAERHVLVSALEQGLLPRARRDRAARAARLRRRRAGLTLTSLTRRRATLDYPFK